MKVFGKYLAIATVNGKDRMACSGFATKREAVEALNAHFTQVGVNQWQDSLGQNFRIEKNTKEYR